MIYVTVTPSVEEAASGYEGLQDFAFDATMGIGDILNIEVASDEWQNLYNKILHEYNAASKFMLYYLHFGVLSVKLQLESGYLKLVVPTDSKTPDQEEIGAAVMAAAKPIASCLLHLNSVGQRMLIPDDIILSEENGLNRLAVDLTILSYEKEEI